MKWSRVFVEESIMIFNVPGVTRNRKAMHMRLRFMPISAASFLALGLLASLPSLASAGTTTFSR
jgi:hypothetical protein